MWHNGQPCHMFADESPQLLLAVHAVVTGCFQSFQSLDSPCLRVTRWSSVDRNRLVLAQCDH